MELKMKYYRDKYIINVILGTYYHEIKYLV